ncbi:hypothetical protein MMMDOFMJ_0136 [Methylobacterium gnaphalii]|uniref:HTH cro/C1-type domain-containing protein n=2 Tax=Methylobacterium gnaphalii TaxID=1010610 RepID=A0A512JIW1_9HYPH|nr:hypothetical protein MGN01_17080 [Methylobacterium gnaphalii]GJD67222.1 hypothetical protein MMMDOFMJ_0136 [Methylobacterium gnaphalii]GLS49892.1 hypothetical protein GCM10007885_27440 [Methylobacterium gnaphalii]
MGDEKTKHDRLREAREKRYPTAKAAAEAMDVPYGTYSGHEAGSRGFTDEEARRYAKFFHISAGSLVFGEHGTLPPMLVPFGGRIGAGGSIDTSSWQSEPGIEYEIETVGRFPDAVIAYQVVGESMLPIYEPDTVILCRSHTRDVSSYIGKRVALGTVEHGRQLKVLLEGSADRRYDLESINRTVATMRNVEVEWAARICGIIPADEWHLIERRVQHEERLRKPSQRKRSTSS